MPTNRIKVLHNVTFFLLLLLVLYYGKIRNSSDQLNI